MTFKIRLKNCVAKRKRESFCWAVIQHTLLRIWADLATTRIAENNITQLYSERIATARRLWTAVLIK